MQPYCKTDNTQPGRLTLKKLDTNNSMWFVHCAWHTPKQWRPLPVPLIFVQTVKSKRSWYLHEIFDVHAVSCHWTIRRRLNTTKTNATLHQRREQTSKGKNEHRWPCVCTLVQHEQHEQTKQSSLWWRPLPCATIVTSNNHLRMNRRNALKREASDRPHNQVPQPTELPEWEKAVAAREDIAEEYALGGVP